MESQLGSQSHNRGSFLDALVVLDDCISWNRNISWSYIFLQKEKTTENRLQMFQAKTCVKTITRARCLLRQTEKNNQMAVILVSNPSVSYWSFTMLHISTSTSILTWLCIIFHTIPHIASMANRSSHNIGLSSVKTLRRSVSKNNKATG